MIYKYIVLTGMFKMFWVIVLSIFIASMIMAVKVDDVIIIIYLPELQKSRPFVSVLCRMCHVFPPLVSIFGLFPVLVRSDYEFIRVQVCLCDYVLITLCI